MDTLHEEEFPAALRDTPHHKRVLALVAEINAVNTLDDILDNLQLKNNILSLFDADRLTIYTCLHDRKEVVSVTAIAEGGIWICVPMDATSIAGYVASRGKTVNIRDAYDLFGIKSFHPEIQFDRSWDQKTGYVTRQVLCVPISDGQNTLGALQLLNKTTGDHFTGDDVIGAESVAEALAGAMIERGNIEARTPTRFDLLLDEGLLAPDTLKGASDTARETAQDIEDLLIREYGIQKADLGRALSAYYQCEFVEFSPMVAHPKALRTMVEGRFDYLRNQLWMPIGWHDNNVRVILENPKDLSKLDTIKIMLQPYHIECVVGLREDILHFIEYAEEGEGHAV